MHPVRGSLPENFSPPPLSGCLRWCVFSMSRWTGRTSPGRHCTRTHHPSEHDRLAAPSRGGVIAVIISPDDVLSSVMGRSEKIPPIGNLIGGQGPMKHPSLLHRTCFWHRNAAGICLTLCDAGLTCSVSATFESDAVTGLESSRVSGKCDCELYLTACRTVAASAAVLPARGTANTEPRRADVALRGLCVARSSQL